MRYSSSSAARSPCGARSTRRRTFSVDSRAAFFSVASTPFAFPGLAGSEPNAAGAAEPAEIRHPGNDHVVGAVLGLEDDDPRPVLVERPLQLVGGGGVDEAADHLPALEPDLDPHALASQRTPPP